jgi:predicted O-methyltransferase YrrM
MKSLLLKFINIFLSLFNLKIVKTCIVKKESFFDIFDTSQAENKIIHLNKLSALSENIRGMINHRAGEELFSLAYMQSLRGDVLEVGSFQGKSTFFLGHAVAQSKNGKMYAVDHFKGNLGKENFYKVEKSDLSDLEMGFNKNIERAGLSKIVSLINKPNYEAVSDIEDNSVRFLYIDADHTADGVRKDLALFKSKLKAGAIIVFDDYDEDNFSGLVSVVNEFISKSICRRKYLIDRTLIIELNDSKLF